MSSKRNLHLFPVNLYLRQCRLYDYTPSASLTRTKVAYLTRLLMVLRLPAPALGRTSLNFLDESPHLYRPTIVEPAEFLHLMSTLHR